MPSRLMSQKINVSESISKLSPMEEMVFLHLIVSCDDYGRFYGNPRILKGMLFPLRDFTDKDIEAAIRKLESEGMIRRYEVEGTVYMELTSWFKYQKPRAKASKYPSPDGETVVPYEAEEESEEPIQKDDSPAFISLILENGEHTVTEADVQSYKMLYPDVNVEQELRNMAGWCSSNPAKRKKRTGVRRFISNWLVKAQKEASQRKEEFSRRNGGYRPNILPLAANNDNPFR